VAQAFVDFFGGDASRFCRSVADVDSSGAPHLVGARDCYAAVHPTPLLGIPDDRITLVRVLRVLIKGNNAEAQLRIRQYGRESTTSFPAVFAFDRWRVARTD
jgi:hypothetical protein